MKRILHVTECHAGGVSRAIETIVELVPECEHHLLWTGTEPPATDAGFATTERLPSKLPSRVMAIRRSVRRLQPQVLHAHSSWAGLYSRITRLRVPVVYQPHCYKFEDPTLNPLIRFTVEKIEKLLTRNTSEVIVLSPHEEQLAKALNSAVPRRFVPNVPTLTQGDDARNGLPGKTSIVMIGRISPQKDPAYFIEVANAVRKHVPELGFKWIGDGDAHARQRLVDAGIEVTGWLEEAELRSALLQPMIYLHSAAYEGFPLSVLDAAEFGIPLIVRNISAFHGTPLLKAQSSAHAAELVLDIARSEVARADAVSSSEQLLQVMNVHAQREALMATYTSAGIRSGN